MVPMSVEQHGRFGRVHSILHQQLRSVGFILVRWGPWPACGLQAGFESGLLRRVFTRGVSGISDQVCCEFNRAAAVGRGKVFT